ncbi:MAG: hypothetical protein P1P85_05500 [Patescibacteria group bacterium]|nr:hypothetical protein [Patescibacteria group bacterium]
MKIITLFSGKEYLVEDKEADEVATHYNSNALLRLKNGARINPKGIESIDDLLTVPYWQGYLLEKSGRSFVRDGQRVNLEKKNFSEIEYKPHPKYEAMKKALLDKTKMLSDKQMTEVSEEISRKERSEK